MGHQLRDYQARGLAEILAAYRGGARKVLAVLPTAGGKTSLFTHLISDLAAHGSRSLVLVHRRELATQACNRLREFGVDFGLIMHGEKPRPMARAQVASVQTLIRRQCPPAGLVIADEAHLSTAESWRSILDQYPNAKILGVTATPWRLSGKPLAGMYDDSVVISTPRELRELGWLCPYAGFSYKTPDLSQVRVVKGEFDERQTAAAMSDGLIVDNIVEEWGAHARGMSTVVFAASVENSKDLTTKFRASGVSAEHLDGQTPKLQRDAILRHVAEGHTTVLCNVGVAVEGLDIPRLKCCVLGRPTMSLSRAIQMQGRVRRPWNGITARIHDHAFVIKRHGLPDDDRDYGLNAKDADPPSLKTCEQCQAMYRGPHCPACNHENRAEPTERVLNTVEDAEKVEFASGDPVVPRPEIGRPPIRIRWDAPRALEGIFGGTFEEQTEYGMQKRHRVAGAKRDYILPGTKRLNALMARVPDGSKIRVAFIGETKLPDGKRRKEFDVEVDDGC